MGHSIREIQCTVHVYHLTCSSMVRLQAGTKQLEPVCYQPGSAPRCHCSMSTRDRDCAACVKSNNAVIVIIVSMLPIALFHVVFEVQAVRVDDVTTGFAKATEKGRSEPAPSLISILVRIKSSLLRLSYSYWGRDGREQDIASRIHLHYRLHQLSTKPQIMCMPTHEVASAREPPKSLALILEPRGECG